MDTQYPSESYGLLTDDDRRIAARLPVKRLNVIISGAVLTTVDISNGGAQVHCPRCQFPLIESLLQERVEMVIELPIGREVTADASVAYIREDTADVYIGFGFEEFRYQDQRGWLAFIASQHKATAQPEAISPTRFPDTPT